MFDKAVPLDPAPYTGAHPNVGFDTPSGNISCLIVNEGGSNRVECTITHYNFNQPGPDCPNGATLGIDDLGAPDYQGCSRQPDSGYGRPLPYGHSLANGHVGCAVTSTAMVCLDLTTGQGFSLSRDAFKLVR